MMTATVRAMETDDKRTSDREPIDRTTTLRASDERPMDVTVIDLSREGFRFDANGRHFPIGTAIRVGLSGAGTSEATIVRRDHEGYGCAFLEPLSYRQLSDAFRNDTAVALPFQPADRAAVVAHEYDPPKWPGSVRVALIVGIPAALWAVIGLAIVPALH